MGVAGQHYATLAGGQPLERVGHRQRARLDRARGLEHVEPQGREHLIIARAAGMQAPAGGADPRRQTVLEGGLAILLIEGDAPAAGGMLGADGHERGLDGGQVCGAQQCAFVQHAGMGDRGAHVVGHQPVVETMVIARRVLEHAGVQGRALVPEPRHGVAAPCCSAGLKTFRSSTTRVPVPSLVKISASRLSADL